MQDTIWSLSLQVVGVEAKDCSYQGYPQEGTVKALRDGTKGPIEAKGATQAKTTGQAKATPQAVSKAQARSQAYL